MVGFLCTVSGKLDPNEFFFGLMLRFDNAPPLAVLKVAIETKVMEDGIAGDGAQFIVSDLEILDFRLNMWVNLESRTQLYSGCHITAIRDTVTASCAGPLEVLNKSIAQKVLGFAADAQKLFELLDVDNEGVVRMRGMIKVLRHDVNYAVDCFTKLDRRATGEISFQDFMSCYNDQSTEAFFDELRARAMHGGWDSEATPPRQRAGQSTSDGSKIQQSVNLATISTDKKHIPHSHLSPSLPPQGSQSPASQVNDEEARQMQTAQSVIDILKHSVASSKKREADTAAGKIALTPGMVSKLKSLRQQQKKKPPPPK